MIPIFNLVEHEHPADMPDAVWDKVDAVRAAMLNTIETLSPKDWNFVFTHAGFDIPADVGVYRTVRETAKRRGARFQPVRLMGGKSKKPLLTFDEPEALNIDMNTVTPGAAARAIVAAADFAGAPLTSSSPASQRPSRIEANREGSFADCSSLIPAMATFGTSSFQRR